MQPVASWLRTHVYLETRYLHLDLELSIQLTMPRKALGETDLVNVLVERGQGATIKDLAATYNCNQRTIIRRIATFRQEGRLGSKPIKRRLKLAEPAREEINQLVKSDPFATLEEIKTKLNLSVTRETTRRYIKKTGLLSGISPKKFYVKPIDCEERMRVARLRSGWSVERWSNIVFCDESGLDNSGFHRRHLWREPGTRYLQENIYKAPNKTLRVNFFSSVSIFGTGELYTYSKMNSALYCEIIEDMIVTYRDKFGHDNFEIVHDNAAFATSHETTLFMSRKGYTKYLVRIPPYSPDMNIIENLWALLKHQVRKNCFEYGQTSRREEFIELLTTKWSEIQSDIIRNLFNSLPRRMAKILEAQGYSTKY